MGKKTASHKYKRATPDYSSRFWPYLSKNILFRVVVMNVGSRKDVAKIKNLIFFIKIIYTLLEKKQNVFFKSIHRLFDLKHLRKAYNDFVTQ
jgi:hypothetical protein